MSTQTAIAKKDETFSNFLTSPAVKAKIQSMVSGKDADQFITSLISAVSINPDLQACEKMSLLSTAMQGQALKLNPSPRLGHFYMVPFKNNKAGTVEAQFIMGYKGFVQLAIRSGQYRKLNVIALKQGEVKYWNPLTEELDFNLIEDDDVRDSLDNSHYYGFFEYQNGFKKAICWTHKKMMSHACKYVAGFSKSDYETLLKNGDYKNSKKYWYKDFEGQALKTIIRQLISKWGIMSIEMQEAYERDTDSHELFNSNEKPEIQTVSMNEILGKAQIVDHK